MIKQQISIAFSPHYETWSTENKPIKCDYNHINVKVWADNLVYTLLTPDGQRRVMI